MGSFSEFLGGLQPVAPGALAEYEAAMAEAVPQMIEDVRKRRELANRARLNPAPLSNQKSLAEVTAPLRDHLIALSTGRCVCCGESAHRIQSHPDMKCKLSEDQQACPSCGKSEPEVTFDADTFTLDCDECVGGRFAVSRAYQQLDKQRRG